MSEIHLNDVFDTIQGEGANSGRRALFVRLPFCNLACPWCDTEFNSFTKWSEEQFKEVALSFVGPNALAVVTGGEPSMHKHAPTVVRLLKSCGYQIAMESNGQFLAPMGVDHLTISPKRWHSKDVSDLSKKFQFDHRNRPGEIKLVVDGEDVFEAAKRIQNDWAAQKFDFAGEPLFFLSPEWNEREKWLPQIVEFVQQNPRWRISLQTHKLLGVK